MDETATTTTTEFVRFCHYSEEVVDGRFVATYGLEELAIERLAETL